MFTWKRFKNVFLTTFIVTLISLGVSVVFRNYSQPTILINLERAGFDHAWTPIKIQWLDNQSHTLKEQTLNNSNPGVWGLKITSVENTWNGLRVTLMGIHTYSGEKSNSFFT